jgi:hypothetical protein
MPYKVIWIPSVSNTNITSSQTVTVITVMLFKCLNRSSWNLICTYIMPSEPISMACIINPFYQKYQYYSHSYSWGKTLLLLERLNQSSWNFVYHATAGHFSGIYPRSLPLVMQTLQPFRFLKESLNIAWTPVPIFMILAKYVMPPERLSVTHLMNPFHQYTNIAASQISETKP